MSIRTCTLVAVVALAAIVGPAGVAAGTVEGDAAFTAPAGPSESAASDGGPQCFSPGGHHVPIGGDGPRIDVVDHTSLFTNLTGGGAFGVEADGRALNRSLLALRAGVLFDGVGDLSSFLDDPLERFAVVYDYRFELPMFAALGADGGGYESSGSPVDGVRTADC